MAVRFFPQFLDVAMGNADPVLVSLAPQSLTKRETGKAVINMGLESPVSQETIKEQERLPSLVP